MPQEVAAAYGKILEDNPSPFHKPESLLPYSKAEIRECIELLFRRSRLMLASGMPWSAVMSC